MLTMTDTAADAVHDITTSMGGPHDLGLRIASDPRTRSGAPVETFTIRPAPGPGPDDTVVEAHGGDARIFLEPEASRLLDDRLLHVRVTSQGEVVFLFSARPDSADRRADSPNPT
jgi:iron-sulfur cluster assembly protein